MMKQVFLLLGCLALWFSGTLQATTLQNLYEVTVEVADQGGDARKQGIKDAFDVLLVRITGDKSMPQQEQIEPLREKAAQWVRQFRYERITPEPVPTKDGSGQVVTPKPYLQMHIRFDEEAVNEALWQGQLPVWSKTRPAVLVWIALQDTNGRYLLDPNESSSELLKSLRSHSQRRGVPLVMPLMDLEDQLNITVNDVWAGFDDVILKASQRYAPEAILVGRVSTDFFGGWQVRWTLYQQGQSQNWSASDVTDLSQAAQIGIDGVADDLARRYAHVGGDESGAYWLEITDVKDLQDYARVMRYLQSLSSVEEMELSSVADQQLSFRISVRGGVSSLEQSIALSSTLRPAQVERFSDRILMYRLQP